MNGLSCGAVLQVVQGITRITAAAAEGGGGGGGGAAAWGWPEQPRYKLAWRDGDHEEGTAGAGAGADGSSEYVSVQAGAGGAFREKGLSSGERLLKKDPYVFVYDRETGDAADAADPSGAESVLSAAQLSSSEDHDILALFCTLVKVLFTAGCVTVLPELIRLIEPARKGRDLGQTLVRNEHAYYVCITQVGTTSASRRWAGARFSAVRRCGVENRASCWQLV
jgi:hypothetical protein